MWAYAAVCGAVLLGVGAFYLFRDLIRTLRELWLQACDWAAVHEVVRRVDCTPWGMPKAYRIAQDLATTIPHAGTSSWTFASGRKWEFGLSLWNGGVALARYLCEQQADLRLDPFTPRRTVIELGCGQALVAMVMTDLFPHLGRVVATDGSHEVLRSARSNIATNLSGDATNKLVLALLRWDNEADCAHALELNGNCAYDVVLGADVTYAEEQDSLISAILSLSHAETEVILAHEPREHRPASDVEALLRPHFRRVSSHVIKLVPEETSCGEALDIVLWRCNGKLDT